MDATMETGTPSGLKFVNRSGGLCYLIAVSSSIDELHGSFLFNGNVL
jgi:hypothetical protein